MYLYDDKLSFRRLIGTACFDEWVGERTGRSCIDGRFTCMRVYILERGDVSQIVFLMSRPTQKF